MSGDSHGLLGPYVVDALDEGERRRFEAHLRVCPTCRRDAEELRLVAVRLAEAVRATPSPELRERVLARVARTRRLRTFCRLGWRRASPR